METVSDSKTVGVTVGVKEEQHRRSNVEPILDLSRRDIDDELGDLGRVA